MATQWGRCATVGQHTVVTLWQPHYVTVTVLWKCRCYPVMMRWSPCDITVHLIYTVSHSDSCGHYELHVLPTSHINRMEVIWLQCEHCSVLQRCDHCVMVSPCSHGRPHCDQSFVSPQDCSVIVRVCMYHVFSGWVHFVIIDLAFG